MAYLTFDVTDALILADTSLAITIASDTSNVTSLQIIAVTIEEI